MKIASMDHVVLTVRDAAVTARFYADVLGMAVDEFEGGRLALLFGDQKINLHETKSKILPRAAHPTPGAADICLVAATPLERVIEHLGRHGVAVEEGPVPRTGALGPMTSVYLRDPDGNKICALRRV